MGCQGFIPRKVETRLPYRRVWTVLARRTANLPRDSPPLPAIIPQSLLLSSSTHECGQTSPLYNLNRNRRRNVVSLESPHAQLAVRDSTSLCEKLGRSQQPRRRFRIAGQRQWKHLGQHATQSALPAGVEPVVLPVIVSGWSRCWRCQPVVAAQTNVQQPEHQRPHPTGAELASAPADRVAGDR
jgi:hypothetical protein